MRSIKVVFTLPNNKMSVTVKVENDYTTLKIKQEDKKDIKIVIHQLQDIASELAERPDIDIKIERTSKVEDGLQSKLLVSLYISSSLC